MALFESKIVPGDLPGFAITIVLVIVLVAAARMFVLKLPERGGYRGQLGLFFLVLLGLLVILIMMPLDTDTRNQVFSLVSIVLSAAVALASTTFLGNLIAGGMLRTVRHFELGDWIRCEGHFGRVTERGLLHTEIQTEDRDLTTLPNLLLATNPVKVVRNSGTIITAKVGLGYDIPHSKVEASLLKAAKKMELEDAFVSVLELADYAVNYRVAGKLKKVDRLISRRSGLRRAMLDALHEDGIEIMSPAFINVGQRDVKETVIPERVADVRNAPRVEPEAVAFDKADVAKGLEEKRGAIEELRSELADVTASLSGLKDGEKAEAKAKRDRLEKKIQALNEALESDKESLKDPLA